MYEILGHLPFYTEKYYLYCNSWLLNGHLFLFKKKKKMYSIIPKFSVRMAFANSVDPDQMPQDIRVYTVCHMPNNTLNTSAGSGTDLFQMLGEVW